MQRTQISSDPIVSIGYEAASSTLELELTSGEVFQFFNVPLSLYVELKNSNSKGDFFHQTLKPAFESKRVSGASHNEN